MNVLFVSHSLGMGGGANRSMVQLMLELRKNHGITPIVLAPFGKLKEGDRGLVEECLSHGIPVERSVIPWFIHRKVWLHRFKYLLLLFYYPILIAKLKKHHVQLVHSNGSVFDLGARISKSFGVPHVWHLREFGTEEDSFKPVWNEKYIKTAYTKASVFIAISDVIKKSYVGRIDERKIVRIYNGIDVNKYQKQAQHNNKRTEFVIVGVVTPHKNQFEAVKATAELAKRKCTCFHLNIIGTEEKQYGDTIRKFISKHQLADYVTFWGLRNDIPEILSNMDVGLMLSKTEAFGRVTIEYMFQNLAVIASDAGANPELITDGETGFLYPLGSEVKLADTMEKLAKTHSLVLDIARKGHEYAIKNFPSEKNSSKIFDLYKKFERKN